VAGLYGLLAIGLLAPMASNTRLPAEPDHGNHIAMIVQARMAIEEGQFPLRVAPWQHGGWRYPVFQFYSPLPYTVAGLVYKWLTPTNPLVAYKIVLWGALLLGGFSLYLSADLLTRSRRAALLAGVVYMTAPYFLINVHARGAFTESVAQGLLPLVIYCSLRCHFAARLSPWLFAAGISWALLALTHTITYVWGAFFIGLFFVAIAIHRRGIASGLWYVGAAFALGCALSMYFLALMGTADYLRVQRLVGSMFMFAWTTTLPTLLSPTPLPPEPQPGYNISPGLDPNIGWPILVGVGFLIYARWTRQDTALAGPAARRISGVLIGLFLFATVLTWSPIDFWSGLPKLANVAQFPYRLLLQVTWLGALATAYALVALFRGGPDLPQTVGALLLIVLAHSPFLQTLQSTPRTVADIVQRPDTGYGQFDLLIDPAAVTLQPGTMDSVSVAAIDGDHWLKLDEDLEVPRDRIRAMTTPTLHIHGSVPHDVAPDLILVDVTIDGEKAGTIPVIEGPVEAILPLPAKLFTADTSPTARIRLSADHVIERPNGTPMAILATGVEISGLKDAISVDAANMSCTRVSDETRCVFRIADHATNVQLPLLFYPNLLSLTVDGKPAAYMPLPVGAYPTNYTAGRGLNQFMLAGVRLDPGTHEVIGQFQGLRWANWTSGIAWIGTLAGLALLAGKAYARPRT
jgi:hypothetical protein